MGVMARNSFHWLVSFLESYCHTREGLTAQRLEVSDSLGCCMIWFRKASQDYEDENKLQCVSLFYLQFGSEYNGLCHRSL